MEYHLIDGVEPSFYHDILVGALELVSDDSSVGKPFRHAVLNDTGEQYATVVTYGLSDLMSFTSHMGLVFYDLLIEKHSTFNGYDTCFSARCDTPQGVWSELCER